MEVANMATVKKQIKTTYYTATREIAAEEKAPPQARLIIKTILGATDGKISRKDLIEQLNRKPEDGGLTTNQGADRVFGFYRTKLIELGVLAEAVETTEIDVEVPDKPVKVKKEKPAPAEVTAATDGAVEVTPKSVKGKKGKKVDAVVPAEAAAAAEVPAQAEAAE